MTSYDDAFCTKFRGVIHEVLSKLSDQGEIENTDFLYPRSQNAAVSGQSNSSRRPYTFEQFIDHLDENDSTFHNLMELLITITARKEIAKAIHSNDPSNDVTTADGIRASPSTSSLNTESSAALRLESRLRNFNTRTTRECQRDILRVRAVQGEIRGITQRNRRHRTSNESSPSTESLQGGITSPPPTRTVFSTLNAPETGLMNYESGAHDAGTTSRIFRVNQQNNGNGSSTSLVGARRWLQHDVSSIRRRLDQRRDDSTARPGSNTNHTSSPIPRRASGVFSISRDGSHVPVPPSSQTNDSDSVFIQRFLTQSFPSESRSSSSSDPTLSNSTSVPSHSITQASSLSSSQGGLDSTLAPLLAGSVTETDLSRESPVQQAERQNRRERALEVISMAQRAYGSSIDSSDPSRSRAIQAVLNRLNETGGPALSLERADESRTNDFESFSSRRRQDHRRHSAEDNRDEEQSAEFQNEEEEDEGEDGQRSLDRALATLSRADDTLRRINQGRHALTFRDVIGTGSTGSIDNRDPLALRLEPSDIS